MRVERLTFRIACSECGDDHQMPAAMLGVPFVCAACWFWYEFESPAAKHAPRIVTDGMLYGIDTRSTAEGIGKYFTVRYYDTAHAPTTTRRLRAIGPVPDGTPNTAIVTRAK